MSPNLSIPLLSADQTPSQASFSKWISIDLLIDSNELNSLLTFCGSPLLLTMQNLSQSNPFYLDHAIFLQKYEAYIADLKKGSIPNFQEIRTYFYLFMTSHLKGISIKEFSADKKKLFYNNPLIEFKPICLNFSKVDQTVRVMPLSPRGILWGFKISFPGIVQKHQSSAIEPVSFKHDPNGILFSRVRKWIRDHTKAAPFLIGSKKVNLPIRLGKKCFNWINHHPQLNATEIHINYEHKN